MKSPRQVLFARHRTAEPKLDAIRRRVTATVPGGEFQTVSHTNSLVTMCRDFFSVPRIAWSGLAAAWMVIIALNVASSEQPQHDRPGPEARRSPEMQQALREQRRLFTELVGAAGEKLESDAPRFIPRPRSERSTEASVA